MKKFQSKALMASLVTGGALLMGAGAAHADTKVTVHSGDTVAKLAQQYDSSVDAITQRNQLADANEIQVGQDLIIPNDHQYEDLSDGATGNVSGNSASGVNAGNTTSQTQSTPSAVAYTAPSNNGTVVQNTGYQGTSSQSVGSAGNNGGTTGGTAYAQSTTQTAAGTQANYSANVNGVATTSQAVNTAKAQIGTPYVWGGNKPGGFDCSGLVQYSYNLPSSYRTTYQQQALGTHHYDVENAQSGDIYFWGSDKAPHHEALATGNGNYIQAPQPGQNVQNGNINWYRPNYYVSMQNHQG